LSQARYVSNSKRVALGEIVCGSLNDRASNLELRQDLPGAAASEGDEVLRLIERRAAWQGYRPCRRSSAGLGGVDRGSEDLDA
jgi:hypothetical protein